MNPLKKISIIISLFLLTGCAEKLDFNQFDDFTLTPVLTSALAYFKAQPFQFFDETGVQQNSKTEVLEFELFQDSFIVNNVVQMVFNAEFKNELDRDVHLQVDLLSNTSATIYSFKPIFVASRVSNPPAYEEAISIALTPSILNVTQVRIIASLEDTGTPMNPADTSEFELKSSITLFIESDL
jgi:hypothetical protein